MVTINKDTTLEDIIIDTIDELGWKNENINLLYEIPKEHQKELNVVICAEFFYNGSNPRYNKRQIERIKNEWLKSGNIEKYDKYLLKRLQPNIIKYLDIHNKKWVRISVTDVTDSNIKPRNCDIYRVSRNKITLIDDN